MHDPESPLKITILSLGDHSPPLALPATPPEGIAALESVRLPPPARAARSVPTSRRGKPPVLAPAPASPAWVELPEEVAEALGQVVLVVAAGFQPAWETLHQAVERLRHERALGLVYGDVQGPSAGLLGTPARQVAPDFPGRNAYLRAPFQVPLVLLKREALRELPGLPAVHDACLGSALVAAVASSWLVWRAPELLATSERQAADLPVTDCRLCHLAGGCSLARDRFALCGYQGYRPFKISFILTTRCNMDCKYCFTRRHNWDIPWEDARRMLIQAHDLGAREVAISGGEPSLYRDLDDLFELCRTLDMQVTVFSNGWHWPEERLQRFLSYDKLDVAISMEGVSEDTNDELRGWHAHAEVTEFVRNIRRIRPDQRIWGIVVITPENLGDLDAIAGFFLDELHLSGIRYDRAVPTGNALDARIGNFDLTRTFLARTEEIKQRYPGRVNTCNVSFGTLCPMLESQDAFEVSVFANGLLPPCVFLYDDEQLALGTTQDDLLDVLRLDRMQQAADKLRVLASHRDRLLAEKGIFNCVECMETYNALRESGELDAYLNLRSRMPIPAGGSLSLEPPTRLPAPRGADGPLILLG
ncbi:MAG: radical SAM protein [Myxococcota bacterium]|jgi:MoaA/NifB/PqqE/SkfB family radical SAM enzyme|nr:radical SAM protein [Myxococcota bacterium]